MYCAIYVGRLSHMGFCLLLSYPVTSMLASSERAMQLILSSWSPIVSLRTPFLLPAELPLPILEMKLSPKTTERIAPKIFLGDRSNDAKHCRPGQPFVLPTKKATYQFKTL